MYRVLIIEDDRGISEAIKNQLGSWGVEAVAVNDFREVMAQFAAASPHLVLIDVALPFYNGYHWCSEIRRVSSVPIIFISSASDNMNIIMAMNMGADDFISKPFDSSVLTAKVRALLRRTYDFGANTTMIEHRGVILNTSDCTLYYNGERIELSKNEYRILSTLMESKGRVVSRERLMERLWETDSFVDDNTLTVNVNRLRRKLADSGIGDLIATKVGVGYIIE